MPRLGSNPRPPVYKVSVLTTTPSMQIRVDADRSEKISALAGIQTQHLQVEQRVSALDHSATEMDLPEVPVAPEEHMLRGMGIATAQFEIATFFRRGTAGK
ncbi:hypothetical protein M8J77_026053 [Diaphorina citri]|nr:hypothetical protein M8J77_026053 [Diaphorina citri]